MIHSNGPHSSPSTQKSTWRNAPETPARWSGLFILLLLITAGTAQAQATETVTVGSKQFTENVILGHMAAQLAEDAGFDAAHRAELGGSRFLWEALLRGDIDVYPEYTGTILQEILVDEEIRPDELERALEEHGIRMTAPLGFNNTYALGLMPDRAEELGVETISHLREHPDLQFAFTNEFMERGDGWPALREAYELPQQNVQGVDHDISYQALTTGAVDVIDLYSTDAEIAAFGLHVLDDNRDFFTDYHAVFLYRVDLEERTPAAIDALRQLEGVLPENEMIAFNRRSKIDGEHEAEVAASFLNESLSLSAEIQVQTLDRLPRIWQRTQEHSALVGLSMILAVLVSIPIGIIAAKAGIAGKTLLLLIGLTYTMPSLALLALMVPPLGVGFIPATVALFVYSLLPIVWNTYTGLTGISVPLQESARALGLPPLARLRLVELPLAAPAIMAGIKVAAVINIGTATLGALIGAGGYGQPILTGIRRADLSLILEGTLPAAIMTVVVLLALEGAERCMAR